MKRTATAAGLVGCLLLLLAWAGAPTPAVAQEIQVNAADPASAPQGTVNLNVTIKGKGFKRGAAAKFFLTTTTDPDGITVRSTSFVSPGQLVANIDIAATATVAKFDVQVQNADGRTGKGTELFAVTAAPGNSGNPLLRWDFSDSVSDKIRSDEVALPGACGDADYADANDSCEPGHRTASYVGSHGGVFLATRSSQYPVATRALVLDFSSPATTGSGCPNLDLLIEQDPDRDPSAVQPPADPDACVDVVVVRLVSETPFHESAQFATLSIQIDGPDAPYVQPWGKTMQWNAKFAVEFINPLSVVHLDPDTVVLSTQPGLDQADLFRVRKGKDELLGTYHMPFQVTLRKLAEFLPF